MRFILPSFILLLNSIGTISTGGDDILIRLEEEVTSMRKRCNISNSFIADLINTLLQNASLVIENAKILNDTSISNDYSTFHEMEKDESDLKLNIVSTNFSNSVKKINDSIERANDGIDSLKKTVAQSLLSLENEAQNVLTRRQRDELEIIRRAVDRIITKESFIRQKVSDRMKLNTNKSQELFPEEIYDESGWQRAGYAVDEKENLQEQCKRLLASIHLQRFELRPNTRRMDAQRINTTIQIGASDWSVSKTILDKSFLHDTDPIVDAVTFFNCNLMVLSALAERVSYIDAQIQVTTESLEELNKTHEFLLQTHRKLKESGAESAATLALRIGVLETETQMKRIKMEVSNITKAIDISLAGEKMEKQIYVAEVEVQSLNKLAVKKNILERNQMLHHQHMTMVVDSTIETLSTVNELMEIHGAITRELEILEKTTESEIKDEQSKIQAEATEEREQESLSINKIRVIGEEAKASLVNMIEVISGHIFGAFTFVLSTNRGRNQVLFYALTVSLLVFLISMAKEGTSFLFWCFLQSLSMPRLVREWGKGKCSKNTSVILCPDDMRKVEETINLLQQRKKRNAPLRNILIHGAAGTGKSLIARTISESSFGLPYAIMSGADLAPLGSLGASELRKVIEWTAKQKYGGILVIDEAECALGKRIRKGSSSSYQDNGNLDPDKIKASSYARDVLNMFLSLTGGSSGKFMLIITTSNPSAIDEAILDRCDDIIFCSVPGYRERKQILLKEIKSRFSMNQTIQEIKFLSRVFGKAPISAVDSRFNIEEAVTKLSSDCCTKGMTGRDLSSIIRSVHCAVYSSDEPLLTEKIWERVTKEMIVSIQASKLLKK